MRNLSRRGLLKAAGYLGLTTVAPWMFRGNALGAETIVAVEWGGDVVEAMKQIAAKQDLVQVNWVLHEGGSSAILAKIKATWPRMEYDYVSGTEASFSRMAQEDWLETVTPELIPNLADIPDKLIVKDKNGNRKAVPRAVGGIYFGYREDTSPIEIKSMDDLLNPKLKGLICWPGPSQNTMFQLIALALHRDGNESNIEPGWEFMKELAQSGNIGRIAVTDADFTTSLMTGETAVGFFAEPGWATVAKEFKVKRLTKQMGMPTFLYQSGFAIMKNRNNPETTMKFVNHCISPDMSTLYAEVAGEAPLNTKAKTPANLAHLSFSPEEMEKFVYVPDILHCLSQLDAWTKRWEAEIDPLL
jgi:putative spermidine/putrescine transport system substrate-binding protein